MTDNTEKLEALKQQLGEEVATACRKSDATPFERFVAEALCSDDAKSKGLVDRVWVVNLPDARKAIEAVNEWNSTRPTAPAPDAGWLDELRREVQGAIDFTIADARRHDCLDDLSEEQTKGLMRVIAAALARQSPRPVAVDEGVVERLRERIDREERAAGSVQGLAFAGSVWGADIIERHRQHASDLRQVLDALSQSGPGPEWREPYEFVKMVGRLEHTGDEGYVPSEIIDDERDALDGLINQARIIMSTRAPSTSTGG